MPQLAKGGKWVFGWAVVGPERQIPVPPEAWSEYHFHTGQQAIFLRGSRRSGGFAISTPDLWPAAFGPWESAPRVLGQTVISAPEEVPLPPEIAVCPGQKLLVVRGSGNGLGFLAQGPIYELAEGHPDVRTFTTERSKEDE